MMKRMRATVLVALILTVGLAVAGCACCGGGSNVAGTPADGSHCAEGWFSNDNGLVDDFYVGCGLFGTYYGYWYNAGRHAHTYDASAH